MKLDTYTVSYLICGLFRAYNIYLLMDTFYKKRKVSRWKELFMYFLYYVMISAVYLLLDMPAWNLITNLGMFYVLSLCYEGSIKKRLFSSGIIFLLLATVETVGVVCLDTLELSLWENVDSNSVIALVVVQILTFMMAMIFRKMGQRRSDILISGKAWISLMVIPVFTIFEIIILYSGEGLRRATVVVNMVFALVVNFFVFYLYEQLGNAMRLQYEKKVAEEQNRFYQIQLDLMKESDEKVRRIRHDMNNHLMYLQDMLMKQKTDEMQEYLRQMLNVDGMKMNFVRSGNLNLDSILNYKFRMAQEKGIEIRQNINVPDSMPFEPFLWVSILGNLLDNAIEAAEKVEDNPYIDLSILYRKKNVMITIKNSYNGEIKETDGMLHTTKKDRKLHGLGMENIRRAVGENGSLIITHTDKEFMVEIDMYV